MMKGLPGCGKSTVAKEMQEKNGRLVRVNKDELRAMLHNGKWSGKNERQVLRVRNSIIIDALMKGKDVIVDDTNYAPRHEVKLREIAGINGAEFEVIDLSDVTPEVCIERDLKRANSVGQKVILDMYFKFVKKTDVGERRLNPLVFDKKLPYCVVFDLDGTLAHITDRSPYDGKSCASDQVNESISQLFEMVQDHVDVFCLSGRNGDSEVETRAWLQANNLNPKDLFMRAPGDSRKDSIIKEELFDKNIRDKYNVLFVVDDRSQVVKLWRSLGLTVLQCAEGNF